MIYLKSQYLSWLLIYVKFWVNCIFLKGTHISPPPDLIGLIKTYTTLANKNWGAFYWPLRTKLKILRYTLILNWAKFYEVMIYFAFLQTLILLVSIFKPVFNLLYILKTHMVNNYQRVMTSVIVVRYFDLKGLKFLKNYEWNMRASPDRDLRP